MRNEINIWRCFKIEHKIRRMIKENNFLWCAFHESCRVSGGESSVRVKKRWSELSEEKVRFVSLSLFGPPNLSSISVNSILTQKH